MWWELSYQPALTRGYRLFNPTFLSSSVPLFLPHQGTSCFVMYSQPPHLWGEAGLWLLLDTKEISAHAYQMCCSMSNLSKTLCFAQAAHIHSQMSQILCSWVENGAGNACGSRRRDVGCREESTSQKLWPLSTTATNAALGASSAPLEVPGRSWQSCSLSQADRATLLIPRFSRF